MNFEKLRVYQQAIVQAKEIYELTKKFPKDELFGIISQLRRATVSISLNIAEGSSRSKREFAHFLDMARGSCFELVALLQLSLELKYINSQIYSIQYQKITKLTKQINSLKKSIHQP